MIFIKILNAFFDQVAKIIFFLIVALVFFAAMVRWIGYPVAWSIDLAQLLFGWAVFLGADHTLRENKHIGIDYIIDKLSINMQRRIMILNHVMILVFLGIITAYGVYLCVLNVERKFNVLQISYSYATASVPFGCFLMFITVIRKLMLLFKGEDLKKKTAQTYLSDQKEEKEVEKCY